VTPQAPLAGREAMVVGGRRARAAASALARLGAQVVLAGPGAAGGGARALDLADLEAVRSFAHERLAGGRPLHLLVLVTPVGAGALALAAHLLPRLLASARVGAPSRVVFAERARPGRAGSGSSGCLARELHRRLKAAGELRRLRAIAAVGRRAVLCAAAGSEVRSGDCLVPGGAFGLLGAPVRSRLAAGRERAGGEQLWRAHEQAAGVSFEKALSALAPPGPTAGVRRAVLAAPRRISAMVRVRDEEEFLHAAVTSIAERVDEIVLVDNLSADRTPEIIRHLAADHSDKLAAYVYPHPVARVGGEQAAAARGARRAGVHTLAEYYNWCLARCTQPFVLKWDGDMVALDALDAWLERWRTSREPVLAFRGVNVHPDRAHLAAARCTDREELASALVSPGMPSWASSLTYDSTEARLFPRAQALYTDAFEWVESLSSPFLSGPELAKSRLVADEPCFLHLKLCKRDPWSGYTADLAKVIGGNVTTGPPLDPDQARTLHRFGLDAR
jgi:hypothetical protein